jgi:hypothetical protein
VGIWENSLLKSLWDGMFVACIKITCSLGGTDSMALGRLDIQKTRREWTVIFEENNGSSFVGGFDREEVSHLLGHMSHGLTAEEVAIILAELDSQGRVIVDNLDIVENEFTSAGMTNLPYQG